MDRPGIFFFFLLIPGFSPLIHFCSVLILFRPFPVTYGQQPSFYNTTQTSMPPVGFEPTIPVSERPKTHALDRAATGIGMGSNPGLRGERSAINRLSHGKAKILVRNRSYFNTHYFFCVFVVKGPAAEATDAPQPGGFLCNPVIRMKRKMISFFVFPCNGAPVE
jgi:hypothetical protein